VKRTAFIAVCNINSTRGLDFLKTVFPQVPTFDENMQLAVIELIKIDANNNTNAKAGYLNLIVSLLESSTPAVRFEAAAVLMGLTSSFSAVQAVAKCYIDLAVKESDNNVKLIVLDRLSELRQKNDRVLDDLAMDVMRILSSPDIGVCRKAVMIVLEMLATRNVQDVINFFTKEIAKTNSTSNDKNTEYRQLLIHAIHQCAIKFPDCAAQVVHVLMDFLGDQDNVAAVDVITFVKEVVERNQVLRKKIVQSLLEAFPEMKVGKVLRSALWILGEFCGDAELIELAFRKVRLSLGELPIVASEERHAEAEAAGKEEENAPETAPAVKAAPQRRVLADGTYATESAFSAPISPTVKSVTGSTYVRPPLRSK
jgi:coatomer subunit beta